MIYEVVAIKGENVDFYRIDVDEHGEIAARERISSVPQSSALALIGPIRKRTEKVSGGWQRS